ncbi:unnamed protein product [Fraxinus pennsylvanica]|uniref:Uncharacterized protein n=1 Tax=Fraxinus pennsylvanica TaxID=56036 RepID=A0AAD1ZUN0_9LAMI|nr:unnamed protein product [Fraxinus pennsylvanica]
MVHLFCAISGFDVYGGFDFAWLGLGLLAAQAACMVATMMALLLTDWEFEAQRAKQLTGANDFEEIEENNPLLAENKEDAMKTEAYLVKELGCKDREDLIMVSTIRRDYYSKALCERFLIHYSSLLSPKQ